MLASRKATPNPSRLRLGAARPIAVVRSAKVFAPRFWKNEVELEVEVGDRQVDPAVAVQVAGGDAHPRLVATRRVGRHARVGADLLEAEAAEVVEQVVRTGVIGDEHVNPAVVIEVGRDDAEAPPVPLPHPGNLGDVDEAAAIVAEDVVGQRLDRARVAREVAGARRVLAEARVVGVPDSVVADVEIDIAVAVEIGEGRRRRPVAGAAEPGAGGRVLEGAIAPVAEQCVRPPARDEQIRMSVVVEVADGRGVAVAPGEGRDPGRFGRVLEGAVAPVAKETIGRRETGNIGARRERTALDGVYVEPAVAVEIEQGDAPTRHLRELVDPGRSVVVDERIQARLPGVVDESGYWP